MNESAFGALSRSQLVIMQNCIDEIVDRDASALAQNVWNILEAMPARSALILADFTYASTLNLMQAISDRIGADEHFAVICTPIFEQVCVRRALPSPLRQHLLTGKGGLMARVWVKQHVLGVLKQSSF